MQDSFLTQVALPLTLAIIMFGMGLSLTLSDFRRLLAMPGAIVAGLTGQMIVMPAIAFGIALLFNLPVAFAIGLMILAACPGGTMSNVICHVGRANLALSVSLTAFSTVLCVVTTPAIIGFALNHFSSTEESFSLTGTSLSLLLITFIPLIAGMVTRYRRTNWSQRVEPLFRRFSLIFMLIMIVAIIVQERHTILQAFSDLFVVTILLNLLAIVAGVVIARLARLNTTDSITLGIEIGIQNASMAMLIALTFLQRPDYAIAAGVYGLTMYIGAGALLMATRYFAPAPSNTLPKESLHPNHLTRTK